MKKILFFLAILIVGMSLTSFVIYKQSLNAKNHSSDWKYYTTVTGWYPDGKTSPVKIFYREAEKGRYYGFVYDVYGDYYPGPYDYVYRNKDYQNSNCYDDRYKYQYMTGVYYFNANLPYFVEI